jgi:hypothetical protein
MCLEKYNHDGDALGSIVEQSRHKVLVPTLANCQIGLNAVPQLGEQCRLTRARGSSHDHNFTDVNFEIDVKKNLLAELTLTEVVIERMN